MYQGENKPYRSKGAGFEVYHVSIVSVCLHRSIYCDKHVRRVEAEPAVAPRGGGGGGHGGGGGGGSGGKVMNAR